MFSSCRDSFDGLAGKQTIGSMPGWRFAFLSVALVSLLIGALTFMFGKEPRKATEGSSSTKEGIDFKAIPGHMAKVMQVPTFNIIVLQVSMALPLC